MISGVIISLPTYSLSYDACFQDLTQTHIEWPWLPIVRLSWLPFRWREQKGILNTLGCRLSCKKKSIKRKSCFEEQTPFCGLLLVSILNSCLEYRLNDRDVPLDGVAFSRLEWLEWGRKFTDFWSKQAFKMGRFSVKKSESCCLLNLTISSHWPHFIPPFETTLIR